MASRRTGKCDDRNVGRHRPGAWRSDGTWIAWRTPGTRTFRARRRRLAAAARGQPAPSYVAVPTGVARYPKEVVRYPRTWVERRYNVTYWAEMPRGGHFAAMEQPELFVDDLRSFFRTVR